MMYALQNLPPAPSNRAKALEECSIWPLICRCVAVREAYEADKSQPNGQTWARAFDAMMGRPQS